jgi:4-hydroxy-4-methyl-2-oxoglutarate aldolase
MSNIIEKYKELATTCVSDALNGLNNMDPAIKPVKEDLRVVGRAYTVKVRAADNHMVLKAIREAQEGDVLVVDAKGYINNASFGDFMIALAQKMGISGIVLDGAVRDIVGIKNLNFPVFCRGVTTAASDKSGSGEVRVPISCGNTSVKPGDIIIGDADGRCGGCTTREGGRNPSKIY